VDTKKSATCSNWNRNGFWSLAIFVCAPGTVAVPIVVAIIATNAASPWFVFLICLFLFFSGRRASCRPPPGGGGSPVVAIAVTRFSKNRRRNSSSVASLPIVRSTACWLTVAPPVQRHLEAFAAPVRCSRLAATTLEQGVGQTCGGGIPHALPRRSARWPALAVGGDAAGFAHRPIDSVQCCTESVRRRVVARRLKPSVPSGGHAGEAARGSNRVQRPPGTCCRSPAGGPPRSSASRLHSGHERPSGGGVSEAGAAGSVASRRGRGVMPSCCAEISSPSDNERSFDRVLQFPDVARPLVRLQQIARLAAQAGVPLADLGSELTHEVRGQEQDVFTPLAQSRQMDAEHRFVERVFFWRRAEGKTVAVLRIPRRLRKLVSLGGPAAWSYSSIVRRLHQARICPARPYPALSWLVIRTRRVNARANWFPPLRIRRADFLGFRRSLNSELLTESKRALPMLRKRPLSLVGRHGLEPWTRWLRGVSGSAQRLSPGTSLEQILRLPHHDVSIVCVALVGVWHQRGTTRHGGSAIRSSASLHAKLRSGTIPLAGSSTRRVNEEVSAVRNF